MGASDHLEDELLDHVFRNASYTSPTTVYLALYTSDPGDDNSGTEVTGGSYARQSIAFDAPSGGVITNSADVEFTDMPAATVSHWGLFDASTAGNLLAHDAFDTSKAVGSGDTATVESGQLSVTVT